MSGRQRCGRPSRQALFEVVRTGSNAFERARTNHRADRAIHREILQSRAWHAVRNGAAHTDAAKGGAAPRRRPTRAEEVTNMATKKNAVVSDVTQQVLDRTPVRVTKFMQGTHYKPIRAMLQKGGFREKDFDQGLKLLRNALAYNKDGDESSSVFAPMADEVADAIKELDGWDESGYRRARAALGRLHPEQCTFVFEGLTASTGMQAALGVMTFLDRLDAFESSPERKSTRKEDHAALETLATRGIDAAERARLRKLTKVVATSPDLDLDGVAEEEEKREAARQKALVALRAWFMDWSETARSVIPRRDYLIRLGLANRKANGAIVDVGDEDGDDNELEDEPVVPKKKSNGKPVVEPTA